MRFSEIIKLFENGNVCVTGLRGCGKDMLMANVVARRNIPYVSNTYYGGEWRELNLSDLDCGKNSFRNFIEGNINPYVYPYPDKTDVYIGDCGIYFPSQSNNEIDKHYPYLATFQALTRHLYDGNFHCNCQKLSRIYLKIREQSDTFILCRKCIYIFGYVLQFIRIYNNPDSCDKCVPPFPCKPPLFASRQLIFDIKMREAMYTATHGHIKNGILFYKNKSTYDTRIFRSILKEGNKGGKCL